MIGTGARWATPPLRLIDLEQTSYHVRPASDPLGNDDASR